MLQTEPKEPNTNFTLKRSWAGTQGTRGQQQQQLPFVTPPVPGATANNSHVFSQLDLRTGLCGRYHCSHFMDEETESRQAYNGKPRSIGAKLPGFIFQRSYLLAV